jgi:AcrR family transcriptional regulator
MSVERRPPLRPRVAPANRAARGGGRRGAARAVTVQPEPSAAVRAESLAAVQAESSVAAQPTVPPGGLLDIQRSRLLAAAIAAVGELGYKGATVAHITARARISRRTFYELFANREECLLAALQSIIESIESELAAAGLEGLGWSERLRGGLCALLGFFDREPLLAQVCVVQALQGGPAVLARREQLLARLIAVVEEGRSASPKRSRCTSLTAEGLVGAGFAIVHARLQRREHRPLIELLGELMGMIVLPYQGSAAARREQERPIPERRAHRAPSGQRARIGGEPDPLASLAIRLTYRTAQVLSCVGEHPHASNRVVANHAGITDQGQASKLLARLQRLGLLQNTGVGHSKGEANAWILTAKGQQVTDSIHLHIRPERQAA